MGTQIPVPSTGGSWMINELLLLAALLAARDADLDGARLPNGLPSLLL
jgi:hypothetical protein